MFWIKITLNIVLLIILIYLTYTNDNLKQNKLFLDFNTDSDCSSDI